MVVIKHDLLIRLIPLLNKKGKENYCSNCAKHMFVNTYYIEINNRFLCLNCWEEYEKAIKSGYERLNEILERDKDKIESENALSELVASHEYPEIKKSIVWKKIMCNKCNVVRRMIIFKRDDKAVAYCRWCKGKQAHEI